MRIRSLQTRIAIAFALLLIAVQALGLVLINTILSQSTYREVEQKLLVGQRIFRLLHDENSRQLAQAASILALDFAFREAVASNDGDTVISALRNQGSRINADVSMLAGLDDVLIADTLHPDSAGKAFPFAGLSAAAREQGKATSIVLIDGHAYDLVLVPVLAPVPIGWLAMGFIIDDKFAQRLQSITSLEVSFVSGSGPAGEWTLLATTMASEKKPALIAALSHIDPAMGNATLKIGGEDYVAAVSDSRTPDGNHVVAVLKKSLLEELAPLRQLRTTLLWLGAVSLLATIFASILIARSMTRPLSALGAVAQKIEQGDYSQAIEIERADEIGRLAAALNHMRQGIAVRESKISDLAYRDGLTGLPNRALFHERLAQVMKNSKRSRHPATVLIMDLDRFRDVNDTLGYQVGDLLLQAVAQRCTAALLRESDTIARLGGNEFGILLPSDDVHGAQVVARRLQSVLAQPVTLEGQQIVIESSIGIAAYPEHGEDIEALLRRADMAMYAAKRNNSGFAIYDPGYDQQSPQRVSLMAELRNAVEHDELTLYYQPKIDLATGAVDHVEALVRWIHPQRGFIPPNEFIPFAENTGYIKAITHWVITRALAQLAEWHSRGIILNVSVNISVRDLLNPAFREMFTALVDAKNPFLPRLALEITESAIMADATRAQEMLEFLRDIGLYLSIDDYGTGYSSLSYLKRLPVNELKIDQSFIREMAKDVDDAIIVRSTIELGHNMELKVVAEGVEDKETWSLLKAWGCDLAQGFLISRPLPPEKLEEWLASRTKTGADAAI